MRLRLQLEMVRWRLRRRTQHLRAACRAWVARQRTEAQMLYLHRFGRKPEQLQPEETFAFRAMWTIALLGLALVITFEVVDPERFQEGVAASLALPRGALERAAVTRRPVRKDDSPERADSERSTSQQQGEQG